jgi:hypothetical protein
VLSLCLWCGETVNDVAHSAHVCGNPHQTLCVDEAGSRPHILDNHGAGVTPPDEFLPQATVRPARTVDARGTVYTPVTVRVPVG